MKRLISLIALMLCAKAALAAPDLRRTIAELVLKDGRKLRNVVVVSYASSAVMARWDGGQGTIQYQSFPDEWRNALEPMRPKPSVTQVHVPLTLSGQDPVSIRSADSPAPSTGTDLEKMAMELAAVRVRLEAIEKKLRMN